MDQLYFLAGCYRRLRRPGTRKKNRPMRSVPRRHLLQYRIPRWLMSGGDGLTSPRLIPKLLLPVTNHFPPLPAKRTSLPNPVFVARQMVAKVREKRPASTFLAGFCYCFVWSPDQTLLTVLIDNNKDLDHEGSTMNINTFRRNALLLVIAVFTTASIQAPGFQGVASCPFRAR